MKRRLFHLIALTTLLAFCAEALSQGQQKPLTRGDVQALMPTAHIETRDELLQLMPSAHLNIVFGDSSLAEWTNGEEGKLEAVKWDSAPTAALPNHVAGSGSWRISEDGRYCGKAGWRAYGSPVIVEWCRFLVRTSEGSYILKSVLNAPDWKLKIAR